MKREHLNDYDFSKFGKAAKTKIYLLKMFKPKDFTKLKYL